MPLTIGDRIGPYEVRSAIGAGGMGKVYRAHDTRLGREVALKALPDRLARDPERIARFEREGRVLAALNHSNIAQVYGLEVSGETSVLVMELVDGEDLSARLAHGPLALDEALAIGRQIADALEAAHERGIVHRDLKPANVKLRADGTVKVLDFGLATAVEEVIADTSHSRTTITEAITLPGIIIGTPAYMSPEQAAGKPIDRRVDIWAFGCIIYEMLTGRRAFAAESAVDTLVAVRTVEVDWSLLPPTPTSIRRMLRRCLQKDPARRLRHIADAACEIDEARTDAETDVILKPRTRQILASVWIPLVLLVSATIVWYILATRLPRASAPEMRAEITTPPTTDPASIAISPDGQALAFIATDANRPKLWVRSLRTAAARPLAGTDGASLPFWSPNGRSIGFFADDGRLKRIDLDGGLVRVLANAPLPRGGSWRADDTILFVPATGPVFRVPASGGERGVVTRITAGQSSHAFPRFLSDGEHFVYYVVGRPEVRGVYVAALDGTGQRRLADADLMGVATVGDYVLFVRSGTLFAARLDRFSLAMDRSLVRVADGISSEPLGAFQVSPVSASDSGNIVYRSGSIPQERQFIWFDRHGKEVRTIGNRDDGLPTSPAMSPDGRRIALHRTVDGNIDIWLLDTDRGGLTRFTTDAANDVHPLWSPDGKRIVFDTNRSGSYELYEKSLQGDSEERLRLPIPAQPTDWSRDGRFLLFQRREAKTNTDIWALPLGQPSKPFPLVLTEFDESDAQFSPDGRWIAYSSVESGRSEIYAQPFPGPGGRALISIDGGAQPRWRADGKALFFIALDGRLMTVPIRLPTGIGSLKPGAPVALFPTRVGGAIQRASRQQYIVSPDGSLFLMNTVLDGPPVPPITLILNWVPRLPGPG